MSGLPARSLTAGHDEIRDGDRLIKFARSDAHCNRRSDRHGGVAPRVHHTSPLCRFIPTPRRRELCSYAFVFIPTALYVPPLTSSAHMVRAILLASARTATL